MVEEKVLTHIEEYAPELSEQINENFKGIDFTYLQVYYLDYAVDERTGKMSLTEKEKFFNKSQMDRNLKNYKNAYYESRRKRN